MFSGAERKEWILTMKPIFIVLIKAHTGLGQLARMVTGYGYTHIAVCLDEKLKDFISYSRKRHYMPLDAGFMHERRDYYAFGKHQSVKVKVFRILMKDCCYDRVLEFISQCENDEEQMFNLFSMLTMPLFHGFRIYKAHNCMSFTAKVLSLSKAVEMDRPYYKYSIKEIDDLLHDYTVFQGKLKRMASSEYERYMGKPSFFEVVKTGNHMFFTLIKRMLFYSGNIGDRL